MRLSPFTCVGSPSTPKKTEISNPLKPDSNILLPPGWVEVGGVVVVHHQGPHLKRPENRRAKLRKKT